MFPYLAPATSLVNFGTLGSNAESRYVQDVSFIFPAIFGTLSKPDYNYVSSLKLALYAFMNDEIVIFETLGDFLLDVTNVQYFTPINTHLARVAMSDVLINLILLFVEIHTLTFISI